MSVRYALLVTGIALTIGSWATWSAAEQSAKQNAGAEKPKVVLTKIHEQRIDKLVKRENDKQQRLSFEKPGLNLTFKVSLPDGLRLLDVSEPRDFSAKDSTGKDLTKIEKNIMGERDYVEVVQRFNEPATQFMMQLALTKRSATTFDLQGSVTITTFAGTKTEQIELDTEWVELDVDVFDGKQVRCRLKPRDSFTGNKVPTLVFEPGTVKSAIEDVQLVRNGQTVNSQSSMWNDQQVMYSFEGEYHKDYRARITLRHNVQQTPVPMKLTRQRLP